MLLIKLKFMFLETSDMAILMSILYKSRILSKNTN